MHIRIYLKGGGAVTAVSIEVGAGKGFSHLAVPVRQQADRACACGRLPQRPRDLRELARRTVAEEGERDVQVGARDDAAVAQLAGLPQAQRVEDVLGEPQRAEEP